MTGEVVLKLRMTATLLGPVAALAAASASAETCTCTAEVFEWTGLAATIPPASWDGCSPSADDDFEPGAGCEVRISSGVVVDLGLGTGRIRLRDDSRLEIRTGAELVVSNQGIEVRDTATLAIQGRALETGDTPAFDAADLTSFTRVDLGEYIPCPGDDDLGGPPVEDCGGAETDPGSTAEAAICWPDDRFDGAPGSTSNFGGYTAQVQVGDVVIFWDYQAGFAPSRDVNAMYEVVDVQYASSTHRCLVFNLEQGDKDQVWTSGPGRGYPLSYRHVKPVTIRGAQEAGDRVIEVDETDVNDGDVSGRTPDFHARWLSCRGLTGWCEDAPGTPCGSDLDCSASCVRELDQHAMIVETIDDPAGDRLTLLPGGLGISVSDGEECYIDYGWHPGDSLAVFRPGRISVPDGQVAAILETDSGAETIDFDFALLDQFAELDLNATTSMHYVWVRDMTAGNHALEIAGRATLHGFQMTGGRPSCAQLSCLHSIVIDAPFDGAVDGTVIEDCNLRHSGDDFIVLSGDSGGAGGSINDVEIRRCRFSFGDGRGGTDSVVDQGTAGAAERSIRLRDFLIEDAGGGTSPPFKGGPEGLMTVRDGALVSHRGAPFASGSTEPWAFRNLFDAQHRIPNTASLPFLRNAKGGYREVTFRDTTFEDGGRSLFARADAAVDLDRLLLVDPRMGAKFAVFQHWNPERDHHWTDVAIVNPQTNNTTFVDRSVLYTNGGAAETYDVTMQWSTIVYPPGATTNFLEGIHLSGNNTTYDTLRHYDGLLIAGLYGIGGTTGAVGGTGGDYNALSGLCLFDNEVDAEEPASLPGDTIVDVDLEFQNEAIGDYRLAPTSPGFGVCGARNAGVRPDNWGLRVLHYDPVANGDSWRSPGFPGGGDWCGDLDSDQLVTAFDVQALREHLSGQAPLDVAGAIHCNVFDEPRHPSLDPDPADLAGACSVVDAAVLLRQFAGLGPSAGAVCAAGSHSACCAPHASIGCGHPETVACVCAVMPACCSVGWDASCAARACAGACADTCGDLVIGPTEDCEADVGCDAGDVCDSSCRCSYVDET